MLVRRARVRYVMLMDTLLTTLLAVIVGIAGWFLRGWFTPAKRSERYDLASKMLDVREKLRGAGFDPGHIEHVITTLESDTTGEKVSSLLRLIGPSVDEYVDFDASIRPSILQTTAAMGARAEAELHVIDAKIEQVLLDLEILTDHNVSRSGIDRELYDSGHIRKLHRAWKLYRIRAGASASEDYAGGSISGIIWLSEQVRISEVFLKDMQQRLDDLKR